MKIEYVKDLASRHWLILAAVCAFASLGVPKVRAQTSETVKLTTNDQLSGTPTFQGQTATTTTTTTTDPLLLGCGTAGTSPCASGLNGLVSTGLPTFDLQEDGSVSSGNLTEYFVVLVPSSATSVSFSVSSTGTDATTVTGGLVGTLSGSTALFGSGGLISNGYTSSVINPTIGGATGFGALSGQGTTAASSFSVYTFEVGSCSSCASISNLTISLSGTSLPPGTTFFAYLTDSGVTCSNGNTPCVVADTDYSSTATVVPEPNTVLLLGSGMLLLLGLAFVKRRSAAA